MTLQSSTEDGWVFLAVIGGAVATTKVRREEAANLTEAAALARQRLYGF